MKNDSNTKSSESLIKLRGHHLICLHFFQGEGYDAEFVENLRNVLKMVEDKEVEICDGKDDICLKCLYLKNEKCQYNEHADEEINEMDSMAINLLNLTPGIMVKWQQIENRLQGIFKEWYGSYCVSCMWKWDCENKWFYQQLKNQTIP